MDVRYINQRRDIKGTFELRKKWQKGVSHEGIWDLSRHKLQKAPRH